MAEKNLYTHGDFSTGVFEVIAVFLVLALLGLGLILFY